MGLTRCLGVAALALLPAGLTGADDRGLLTPYTATVVQTRADVRSGPGERMYVTNRLGRGAKVTVVGKREGGWLAITPPEGSFSWVNERFLKPSPNKGQAIVVAGDGTRVPVLVGTPFLEGKPVVRGTEVSEGTILWTLGQKMPTDDGYLAQIVPPPSEVRYIRTEAVSDAPDAASAVAAAAPPADPRGQPGDRPPEPRPGPDTASPSGYPATLTSRQPGSPLPALPPNWSKTPSGWLAPPPGRLTLADHRIDDQEAYLLLNSQGIPIVYATARPGYTLRTYLDRNLELRGTCQWRDDLRAFHMTVMEVRMVP